MAPLKPINKKYLRARCSFDKQTVVKALNHDALWLLVKQLDPEDQYNIFKIVDHEIKPLTETEIDSLFAYLPNETREGLDFIDMTKAEKLTTVRDNTADLETIIDKKGFTDRVPLDTSKTDPVEEFSSSKLWEIVKSGKYTFD